MLRRPRVFDPDFGGNLATRTPATDGYDAVGNLMQSTDARGSGYTVFMGYGPQEPTAVAQRNHKGELRPASEDECRRLEPAAVWDAHHVLERILKDN